MTDEKKITKGLDKELMQLIDVEMNDPVIGKLLNRNAAYVLGKEIKLVLINKACDWLYAHLYTRRDEQSPANHFVCSKQEMLTQTEFVESFKQAMKGE